MLLIPALAHPLEHHACTGDPPLQLHAADGRYLEGRLTLHSGSADGLTLRIGTRTLARHIGRDTPIRHLLPEQGSATLHLDTPANTNHCYTLHLTQSAIAPWPDTIAENPQPQSPRLQAVAEKRLSVAQFWTQTAAEGTPLIEPLDAGHSLLTFLYRGAQHNVTILGAPSPQHEKLARLPGTDIWYNSYRVANDLILSYEIAADVPELPPDPTLDETDNRQRQRRAILATIAPDPHNRRPFLHASLVTLPDAPALPGAGQNAQGRLQTHTFTSAILNNQRDLWIYQTPGAQQNPVILYLLDGETYRHLIPPILDALVSAQRIPPVTLILIGNHQRNTELPANPDFADMIAEELIPFVSATTGLPAQPERTAIAGSSYGGLAAAYIASRHPRHISRVIPLSGSFWWHPENSAPHNAIARHYAQNPGIPLHWHISAGSYETSTERGTGILESSRELARTLEKAGHHVQYREYHGGHDYALWRIALADALTALFPQQTP